MKINRIYLKNIRSYEEASITLPEGSVLLCGNIGSGKTTILLGIEFALFGLQRGSLNGSSLLRTGKSHGLVEVEFEIADKKVVIQRSLKRNRDTIIQDKGFISINGTKEYLSANELKHRVLKLLNYPPEFLTKTNLLYKYTLYTPQEAMREVLTEEPDTRLNTLRKVFGIDKYKRIIENIEKFLISLRESIKKKEGEITNIEEKRDELKKREKERDELKKRLLAVINELDKAQAVLEAKKSVLERKEGEIKKFNELSSELKTKKSELEIISQTSSKFNEERKDLEPEIKELEKQTKDVEFEKNLAEKISDFDSKIEESEQELIGNREIISSLKTKKSERESSLGNIKQLNLCPVCKQDVPEEHKKNLTEKLSGEIAEFDKKITEMEKKATQLEKTIDEYRERVKQLRELEKKQHDFRVRMEKLEEKNKRLKKVNESINELDNKSIRLKKELQGLIEKLRTFKDIETEYEKAKTELEKASLDEKKLMIRKAELESEDKTITMLINSLKEEVQKKEKAKSDLTYLLELRDWLKIRFTPLLVAMEKEVMARLHSDFSSLFQKWFSMLVTDLSVRLDESFTPILESRGYELDYSSLSGGERTAAALSYRLALNQVINSMISKIQTRDIIILDEPTDGFSSEQLDKMRDVLNDLKVKQLIIVSHESKIEGFVDNIIRFEKEKGRTIVNNAFEKT
jgi:exonuclease SbcC